MAYATYDDYVAQYPDASADQGYIAYLLDQASDAIDMAFRSRGRALPSDGTDELVLRVCKRVACQLVNRIISAEGTDWAGTFADATQATVTAGVYSQSWTLPGNGSNIKLNDADLQSLGLFGGAAGWTVSG